MQSRGAAVGYARAGFEVVGVDIEDQPNYPYKFIKMDAIEFLKTQDISEFDAIHASPPCQAHTRAKHLSAARNGGKYGDHVDLIQATREILQKTVCNRKRCRRAACQSDCTERDTVQKPIYTETADV